MANDALTRRGSLLPREEGLTLVELLVVSILMVAIVTAVLGLYRVSASEQQRVDNRSQGIVAQKNGLERISRELRQATRVCEAYPTCASFNNSSSIDFERYGAGGALYWVRYDCSGSPAQAVPPNVTTRACLRSQSTNPSSLGGSQVVVVSNVATTPTGIFSFSEPNYVTMSLPVAVKGASNTITLDDGVRTRNVNETPDSGEQGS